MPKLNCEEMGDIIGGTGKYIQHMRSQVKPILD
jgi:predicted RNA-binding protein YlqC (UPF0109 family)